MAQGNVHRTEQVFGLDGRGCAVVGCIPLGDAVFRPYQAVGLAVREGELFFVPAAFQLALGLYAVDGLVVKHAPVLLEEGTVASGDVHQHGTETVGAGAVHGRAVGIGARLGPQGGLGAAGIAVARAAAVPCIHRPQPVALCVCVIVESVTADEPTGGGGRSRYPGSLGVVGKTGIDEDSAGAGRKGILLRHVYLHDIQSIRVFTGSGQKQPGQKQPGQK